MRSGWREEVDLIGDGEEAMLMEEYRNSIRGSKICGKQTCGNWVAEECWFVITWIGEYEKTVD